MNIDLKKIEEEVAIQKQVLINEKTKRNENAVLAVMHLRQHLNVYLHKYDFINSSKINKKIVEDISETFKLNKHQRSKIKWYLNRRGIFDFWTFAIVLAISTISADYWIIKNMESGPQVPLTAGLSLILYIILLAMFDESTILRFYYKKDL